MQKIQAQRGQERIEDSHCTTDQYLIKHVLLVYDELIPSFDVRKSLHIGLCIMQDGSALHLQINVKCSVVSDCFLVFFVSLLLCDLLPLFLLLVFSPSPLSGQILSPGNS